MHTHHSLHQAQGGYIWSTRCLSVCLFACRIILKVDKFWWSFFGGLLWVTNKKWLDFGGKLDQSTLGFALGLASLLYWQRFVLLSIVVIQWTQIISTKVTYKQSVQQLSTVTHRAIAIMVNYKLQYLMYNTTLKSQYCLKIMLPYFFTQSVNFRDGYTTETNQK